VSLSHVCHPIPHLLRGQMKGRGDGDLLFLRGEWLVCTAQRERERGDREGGKHSEERSRGRTGRIGKGENRDKGKGGTGVPR
jgi:hypothetical protein